MRILVTGANSMLGSNVVEVLHNKGYEVVALVRRTTNLLDSFCKVELGDVSDPERCRKAMIGCDAVVHIAAVTDTDRLHFNDYSFNWTVTQHLAELAKELGISKFIYISSANSVGNGTIERYADETEPLKRPYVRSLYGLSKVKAEHILMHILPTAIILNPTFMIGKYDSKPSSGYLIKFGYKRRVIFAPAGGKDFVPAIDVANAVCGALVSDSCGKFLVGGYELTFREFFMRLSRIYGYHTTIIVMPRWLRVLFGVFGDLLRLFGIKVGFSSVNMGILNQREFYSSNKAREQLGYSNSSLNEAIKSSTDWMVANKVLKKFRGIHKNF